MLNNSLNMNTRPASWTNPARTVGTPRAYGRLSHPAMPLRTRAAIAREQDAIQSAVTSVVGERDANHLLEIAATMPPEDPRLPPSNAWTRAMVLMRSPEGRRKLQALTWDQL